MNPITCFKMPPQKPLNEITDGYVYVSTVNDPMIYDIE